MFGILKAIEIKTFSLINHNLANSFLDYLLAFFTELGSERFFLYIGLFLMLVKYPKVKKTGLIILSSLLIIENLVGFLKNFFAVSRPFISLEKVHKVIGASGYSFPSGHTTLAFCMAAVLADAFPRHKKKFYFLAFIVGFSRIYLGVHFPSDVLAGLVLGILIGNLMVRINRAIQ